MPNPTLDRILSRLNSLQEELEREIDHLLRKKREQFRYTLQQGKVRFEHGVQALQRHHKTRLWAYLGKARIGHLLTAPVIYSLIIPFVLLDIMVMLYQHICFRVYGIPRVARKDYIIIDRHHLAYLNAIEKINCVYCGYGNGLIEFAREVSARTEQYWCPIKHAQRSPDPHHLAGQFVDYGDADAYKTQLQALRRKIMELQGEDTEENNSSD